MLSKAAWQAGLGKQNQFSSNHVLLTLCCSVNVRVQFEQVFISLFVKEHPFGQQHNCFPVRYVD